MNDGPAVSPERWLRVEKVLHDALDLDPDARAEFLERACANDEPLRREVESLLGADREAEGFMEVPALAVAAKKVAAGQAEWRAGAHVGRYQVLSLIGSGGMGSVYLASDHSLGRRVALKVLPAEFTGDQGRVVRFEREARSASALNHPNILTVHEIGRHGRWHFMVTEFIEGETLRQRIAAPMEIAEAVEIASQIAGALKAAHEVGILHRDIKPENVMLRPDGLVKVLDFGIAKLSEERARPGEDDSPEGNFTQASPVSTDPGTVLGTASYMSPEQARGEELDARTDLFSLGVVLYEMVTGRRLFPGETCSEVLRKLLADEEPAPLGGTREGVPPALEKIIRKALGKKREDRYASAAEMLGDLRGLKSQIGVEAHQSAAGQQDRDQSRFGEFREEGTTEADSTRRKTSLFTRILSPLRTIGRPLRAAMMLLLLIGLGWSASRVARRAEPQLHQLTTNSSEDPIRAGAISPDGEHLAWAEETGISLRVMATGEIGQVRGAEGSHIMNLSWLPDSTGILVNEHLIQEDRFVTRIVPIRDGSPSPAIISGSSADAGEAVALDQSRIAFVGGNGREILLKENGKPSRLILRGEEGDSFGDLARLNNGQRLVFNRLRFSGSSFEVSIETLDLRNNVVSTVIADPGIRGSCATPGGRVLFSLVGHPPNQNDSGLWEINIDPQTGAGRGGPRPVVRSVGEVARTLSVSADGQRLTFFKGPVQADVFVGEIEESGRRVSGVRRLTFNDRNDLPTAWSGDGGAVIYHTDRAGKWEIYRQELGSKKGERLISAKLDYRGGRLTPEGEAILCVARPSTWFWTLFQPPELYRYTIGDGALQMLYRSRSVFGVRCARSPSARCILGERQSGDLVFYALDPARGKGAELARAAVRLPLGQDYWDLSPDGSRVAVIPGGTEEGIIRILSLDKTNPEGPGLTVRGRKDFQSIDWAADGQGFYVSSGTTRSSDLLYVALEGNASVLRKSVGNFATWAVPSPDGRRLALLDWTGVGNIWMVE